jgi:multiple sugar transport system permease protein
VTPGRRDAGLALAFLLPAMALAGLVILVPPARGLGLSLEALRVTGHGFESRFVGLGQFRRLLGDALFWHALATSLLFVGVSVAIEVGLGLAAALALARNLPGTAVFAAAMALPYFIPGVIIGQMWALLLDPYVGPVNPALAGLGLVTGAGPAWLAEPRTALPALILAECWHGFPFFTLALYAALQRAPKNLLDQAAVDGAGALSRFATVTWPAIRPVALAAMVLRAASLGASPDLILVMTGGGPARATLVLPLYAFETAYARLDFGYAAALAVVLVALLTLPAALALRLPALGRG